MYCLISLGQYMVSFVAVNVLFHWNTVSYYLQLSLRPQNYAPS